MSVKLAKDTLFRSIEEDTTTMSISAGKEPRP